MANEPVPVANADTLKEWTVGVLDTDAELLEDSALEGRMIFVPETTAELLGDNTLEGEMVNAPETAVEILENDAGALL